MTFCTPTCQKWSFFSSFFVCLIIGIVMLVFFPHLVEKIKYSELTVSTNKSMEFKLWKETPIPMYIEFYLFNWTNYEKFENGKKWPEKPKFEQVGPYTYSEKHIRKDIVFNTNGTITYKTQRIWHFIPEKSNGKQDDQITTLNVIAAAVAKIVSKKHVIVQIGVNFFIEEKRVTLGVTRTAAQLLFDGYEDPLIDLLHRLNMTGFDIPFDKFGWFYARNNSIDADGVYNMHDGAADLRQLGRFARWNYDSRTGDYAGECGEVRGTSGELWYPVGADATVDVFSPDTCSTIRLERRGEYAAFGLTGHVFVGTARIFDNGSRYPEMACYGQGMPSGVRDVSTCKFGAPAYVSYPHFYLADPIYAQKVDGMAPNPTEHSFNLAIEPESGIPLKVQAAIQVNIRLIPIKEISILANVQDTLMPTLWFKQYAHLTEELANQAKMLLILPLVGQVTGYVLLAISICLLIAGLFVTWKDRSKGTDGEEQLLEQE